MWLSRRSQHRLLHLQHADVLRHHRLVPVWRHERRAPPVGRSYRPRRPGPSFDGPRLARNAQAFIYRLPATDFHDITKGATATPRVSAMTSSRPGFTPRRTWSAASSRPGNIIDAPVIARSGVGSSGSKCKLFWSARPYAQGPPDLANEEFTFQKHYEQCQRIYEEQTFGKSLRF